jgi:hypothetical protein
MSSMFKIIPKRAKSNCKTPFESNQKFTTLEMTCTSYRALCPRETLLILAYDAKHMLVSRDFHSSTDTTEAMRSLSPIIFLGLVATLLPAEGHTSRILDIVNLLEKSRYCAHVPQDVYFSTSSAAYRLVIEHWFVITCIFQPTKRSSWQKTHRSYPGSKTALRLALPLEADIIFGRRWWGVIFLLECRQWAM